MTQRKAPICLWCRWLGDTDVPACKAFPDGIPAPVWNAEDDHTGALPGDHGLRFEAKSEPPPGRPVGRQK